MSRTICLYLHVHQPYRIRPYSIFDTGASHLYFNDQRPNVDTNNEFIFRKVAEKSYLPTNEVLQELLDTHDQFKLSLSITGTIIDQMESWGPDVLDSFKRLVATGKVEIVAETYHHSLAFFYSRSEFEAQVRKHVEKIEALFGVTPTAFRNTELAYNNDIAYWADQSGYRAVITEGWEPVLGWRSPNFVYQASYTDQIRLLMKNYKLSDDIAFRFSNQAWEGWPLTADKYVHWINSLPPEQQLINLFMDYETFGEHQWEHTGIFDFLRSFAGEFLRFEDHKFMTISEAAAKLEPVDYVDVPHTITWADTDRDLTAWLGNPMQHNAIMDLYKLEAAIHETQDPILLEDWRKLQTSDHFYYMCTKWFSDGDVHAYFSPYTSPYDAFMYFNNAVHDLRYRIAEHGVDLPI
jgi:alpha-amylase